MVRRAVLLMLREAAQGMTGESDASPSCAASEAVKKVTLRMPTSRASALAVRARAADVGQGVYVAGLLDGMPPAPLPVDHAAAVQPS